MVDIIQHDAMFMDTTKKRPGHHMLSKAQGKHISRSMKLVIYVMMMMRRDRVYPHNSALTSAGITSCAGYGCPLT